MDGVAKRSRFKLLKITIYIIEFFSGFSVRCNKRINQANRKLQERGQY